MCYFLAIGASTDGWRLAGWLEGRLGDQVEAAVPPPRIAAAFPSDDSVRAVTCRGCSCDLLSQSEATPRHGVASGGEVLLAPACRLALAFLVRQLGAIRIYVTETRRECREAQSILTMTVPELLALGTAIPAHVLVDVVASDPAHPVTS